MLDAQARHGAAHLDKILTPKTNPKEAQSDPKSRPDVVENEKREIINFVYPSLPKSLLLAGNGCQDGASMTPGSEL